jgi:3-hydroxybutyryl-CoA dehydrogenase
VERTGAAIAASLDRAIKKGRLSPERKAEALARITLTTDLGGLAASELVIESIIEALPDKRALLSALEQKVGPACVIASNTSSLPLGELARALKAPTRFLGLHFFSPVPAMKLVEVAPHAGTYPGAVELAQAFVQRIGKTGVLVTATPGYLVNRLLVPLLLDAMSALEAGVARADAIDTAMRLGAAHPMGPLELADAIGLDVVLAMAKTLRKELGDRRYAPPALLRRLVLRGHLGKKTGRGIFDYASDPPCENPDLWPVEPARRAS